MRVLLDECVPRRLKHELPDHDVRTVPEMGWAGRRNGDLLRLAEREFDILLTVDRKLQHEQPLAEFDIAVLVLVARGNRLADLQPLIRRVRQALPEAGSGHATIISESGEDVS